MNNNYPIYHITDINNLAEIIKAGFLFCDNECSNKKIMCKEIAYEGLKQRRRIKSVSAGPEGKLADYVPFYFCNRSPMLSAIYYNEVKSYDGSQDDIIYLVSDINHVINSGVRWCFSDGHPIKDITQFFDNLDCLNQLDWVIINEWDWRNTEDDPDRKRRKSAEFLVYQKCPISCIYKIGVLNEETKNKVLRILASSQFTLPVIVEEKWYYQKRS